MPTDPRGFAAFSSAVRHVNVSLPAPLAPEELLGALLTEQTPAKLEPYLRAFFDETAIEMLSDIARSGLIDYRCLAKSARRVLPPDHETRAWLDERC